MNRTEQVSKKSPFDLLHVGNMYEVSPNSTVSAVILNESQGSWQTGALVELHSRDRMLYMGTARVPEDDQEVTVAMVHPTIRLSLRLGTDTQPLGIKSEHIPQLLLSTIGNSKT